MALNLSEIEFVKTHPNAKIPTRGSVEAAGLDLYAVESGTIPAGTFKFVSAGVAMALPIGYEGQVRPRSGLAAKHGVTVLNAPGTLDSDFSGTIGVILINHHRTADFYFEAGDRIAQLVIAKVELPVAVEGNQLRDTDRGSSGFGSTGK